MVSIGKYEYYYIQSENSIMRNDDKAKKRKKLQDKLTHFDNLILQTNNMNIETRTKENLAIYATNAVLTILPQLDLENKSWFKNELKARKVAKNIKIRNVKQLIKRILLEFKIG